MLLPPPQAIATRLTPHTIHLCQFLLITLLNCLVNLSYNFTKLFSQEGQKYLIIALKIYIKSKIL